MRWLHGLGVTPREIHAHVAGLERKFLAGLADANLALLPADTLTPPERFPRGNFLAFDLDRAEDVERRLAARASSPTAAGAGSGSASASITTTRSSTACSSVRRPPLAEVFDLARRRRRHQRRRHRARRRRPRPEGRCSSSRTTSRGATSSCEHQADPRRPALPRAVRVPPGRRGARRARGAAADRAAPRLAARVRAAARAASAAALDDPRGPLPLRPPRRPRRRCRAPAASRCAAAATARA